MSKKLPYLLSCFFAALSVMSVRGQEYQPLPITSGYNADVIANGTGAVLTTTTHGVDALYSYIATDFKATASSTPITYGVPVNGIINSLVTSGLSYQLGPLTGNNSLRLSTATTLTGTLTLTTPKPLVTLYILGVTGGGSGTVSGVVTFSDNSTQPFTNLTVADWYNNANAAVQGLGRVNRSDNGLDNGGGTNPRMYQIPLAITPANQAKPVKSVTFTRNTPISDEAVNIFALSADVLPSCPSPTNITATGSISTAIATWTAAPSTPAGGYDVYYTTSATAPTASTTPSGNVSSTTTSYYMNGLTIGADYYFWIRSNCSALDKGIWKLVTFKTGQSSTTYTGGDLNTLFFSGSVSSITNTTTTTCPGAMSIVVPAGYKISSISTTYNVTTANLTYMSEVGGYLICTTNNTPETTTYSGTGTVGTFVFNRNNINIANNLTGTVNFELRVFRIYGGSGCTTVNAKVDNGTWKITAILVPDVCTTPAIPTVGNQSICPGSVVGQLSAVGANGGVLNWYTAATGGTPVPYSTILTSGTFYVSQTVGTCESARSAAVIVTVEPTPTPTGGPLGLCGLSTVADLTANGTFGSTFKWYAASNDSTPLASTTPLVTKTYYVSQTVAGCESSRLAVVVTIDTIPVPVGVDQFFCSSATVANFVVSGEAGGVFKWYAAATGGAPLAPTTAAGTSTYYVTQTLRGCESARKPVIVTIGTIVNPTVYPQELCAGSTVANLQASGSVDSVFKWFATADATTPLAATTVVTSGTYYVSQTLGTCESGKTAHTVTINNVATPVIASQTLCAASTVASLVAEVPVGDTVNWYASQTDTNALSPNTVLVTGTYYATHKHNNCESEKVNVQVTINAATPAPSITDLSVCINSTVSDLAPVLGDGVIAKWYATATSVNPLAGTVAVSAGSLYLSQTIAGCEGPRAPVAIIIPVIPAPSNGELTACTGSTFGDVAVQGAEGATFKWYGSSIGDDLFDNTDEVATGTYFVSQVINGCEGSRSQIVLNTSAITLPTPVSLQYFCGSALVSDLDPGLAANATANWFNGNGDPLTDDTPLVNGTYTVTQTIGICESDVAAVLVTINPIPAIPTGEATQDFIFGDNLSHFVVEATAGSTLKWYILVEGEWQSIPNGSILVDGNTYGVSQTINGCESEIFSIDANMVLSTDTFEIKNLLVYPNPSSDIVNLEANETISQVSVFNLLGQEVIRQNVNGTTGKVNISSLPQATYVMQIHTEGGASATLKVVKR